MSTIVSLRRTLAVLLLLTSSVSFATNDSSTDSSTDLPDIIVTATRTARSSDETLAPVTLITRADIERSQAQSVPNLLHGTPGVSIMNSGGLGKLSSVFLRGTNSDHVLVLIDGIKIGSATAGSTAFQDLPVELIDHIEIVRGPRSSLYGSEAIGGVIQIFTRKNTGALKSAFSIGGGSKNTHQTSATLSGGIGEKGWLNAGISDLGTDGFNACNGQTSPTFAGCFTNEPDRDGYHNLSGNIRAGWDFNSNTKAEINWLQARGKNDFDGSSNNQTKTVQQVTSALLHFAPVEPWHVNLQAGQSQDNSDGLKNGLFVNQFNTRRNTFSWQNDITLTPTQQFSTGIDWQNDKVISTVAYPITSRDNTGVFIQYLGNFGPHSLQLSERHDDNQQFGKHNTGNAAWGYELNNALRLTASYGTAFKAPSFNWLYYPPTAFSNPNLRPETSQTTELGLTGKYSNGQWSLNAFETRLKDLIASDAAFKPDNLNSATIRGLEAVASTRFADWDLRGSLSLLDPKNHANDTNNGKQLPRRPEKSIALYADKNWGVWNLGTALRAEGYRYDDLANTVKLNAYATVDLHAEYRLTKTVRLQAKIENLFDKDYQTAFLYNQPGRGVFLTLRYQP